MGYISWTAVANEWPHMTHGGTMTYKKTSYLLTFALYGAATSATAHAHQATGVLADYQPLFNYCATIMDSLPVDNDVPMARLNNFTGLQEWERVPSFHPAVASSANNVHQAPIVEDC